ncbi:MAG: protein kinase, partial [Gemmatimonadales bacterium]
MMGLCAHCATPLPDGSRFCSHCGTPVPGQPEQSPTLTPQGREIFDRLRDATAGRYEILRELGRGGMAVVFLAFQQSLDREIAIKVLLPFLAYDAELVERFLREARTQGKLDHPCIIKVFEVHSEGGLTFFTMPYVSGRSLRTLLHDDPQPPFTQVHRYLCQAADALAYAHRRGVIHRDVKPDNMVLDEDRDCVILTDFGIAKALAAETTLTTPGDLLGTPQYMSPEQGEGSQDLDGRADQYSLGLIAYEMLAGQRAFRADNLAELMYKHRFEEAESLDRLRPDAPREMRRAIMRAISKDRQDRFPTMEGFLSALEACTSELAAMGEDRTEPMPPPGSVDTTLRVATPPGRIQTGQTPSPVSRSPRVTPPGPTPRPQGRTPRPRDRTSKPPELEVPTYLQATTPARGSKPASGDAWSSGVAPTVRPEPSAAATRVARPRRRRRRVGRAVALGLVLAVAATLVGSVVWGPLRPLFERYLRPTPETEANVPEVAILPAEPQEATGVSDQPMELSPGSEAGEAGATTVAGDETPVTGQQTTDTEAPTTGEPTSPTPDESA